MQHARGVAIIILANRNPGLVKATSQAINRICQQWGNELQPV